MSRTKKNKAIDANFIYKDTKIVSAKLCGSYCIGFDVGKKDYLGIAVSEYAVALALSGYFKQMAKRIRKDEAANGKED